MVQSYYHHGTSTHASICCYTLVAVVAMITTNLAASRQMHASIDYQRYLKEADTTQADLDEWRNMYGSIAQMNGWMPLSEDRSADDHEEDLRQRIFLTKQSIFVAHAANPLANFSIMSPFSAMTEEEFSAYTLNSYVRGNVPQRKSKMTKRRLHPAAEPQSSTIPSSIDKPNSVCPFTQSGPSSTPY